MQTDNFHAVTTQNRGTKIFMPLFALASNGKTKRWRIMVTESFEGHGVMHTESGYNDGTMKATEKTIRKGKNIGRSNETTPFQQALAEATSKINKKKDEGYTEDIDNISIPILPMLAHNFKKRGHNIIYPCYVQPKIDGVRCTATVKDGKVVMFTRKGKQFTSMPHIEEAILELYFETAIDNANDFYIDGELYSDTLSFQEVAGTVRREKNKPEVLDQIYLVLFDCFLSTRNHQTFTDRWTFLSEARREISSKYIRLIKTEIIDNHRLVKRKHDEYVKEGYEGIMIRNSNGGYKMSKRSADLQKYKSFQDDEYIIIGAEQGTGSEEGCVVWICTNIDRQIEGIIEMAAYPSSNWERVPDTAIFKVRPRGSFEERKELYRNSKEYLGKLLTVRYQELTDDGKPRFPVGLGIRDYE